MDVVAFTMLLFITVLSCFGIKFKRNYVFMGQKILILMVVDGSGSTMLPQTPA